MGKHSGAARRSRRKAKAATAAVSPPSSSASSSTTQAAGPATASIAPPSSRAISDVKYDDDADDDLSLSAHSLAALNEFLGEQKQQQAALAQLATAEDVDRTVSIDAFREDYQLSQFWYNADTISKLSRVALKEAGPAATVLQTVLLLEFDRRFKPYSGFVFYDYNEPLRLPKSLCETPHTVDVIVVDPPFLSPECLEKVAQTIRLIGKGKVILCTGAIMTEHAEKLLQCRPTQFRPVHRNRLSNEFRCFTNFDCADLPYADLASRTVAEDAKRESQQPPQQQTQQKADEVEPVASNTSSSCDVVQHASPNGAAGDEARHVQTVVVASSCCTQQQAASKPG